MIVLMLVSPARMKSRMNAVATAKSASAIGMAVATNVRKTSRRTMNAARKPSSSCVPCSIGGNSASPLNSAVTPGGLDRLANSVLHGDDPRSVRGLDDVRELRLRVGDPTVLGEGLLGERVADAVDADLVPARGELRRLELRDRVLDRGLALGRVEPLALGRREDEVEHRALLGGELRLDEIGRALRVRARDLELVLEAPADGRDEQDEDGDDPHPAEDDLPRVVGAPAHPAREAAGRQSFVCREMVLLFRHAQTPR